MTEIPTEPLLHEPAPECVALGVDVGGTSVKAALVDCAEGTLAGERYLADTPRPATPESLVAAIATLVEPMRARARLAGVAFPAVIKRGIALTAENVAEDWRYIDVAALLGPELEVPVQVLNDADAAGLAEVRFGAGRGVRGTIVVVTLGTGIGTSLFVDGTLVPNTELARMQIRGKPASERASNRARKKHHRAWADWAADVQELLWELDRRTWPELVIVGGGASAHVHRWLPFVTCRPPIVPARMRNHAGIVGAATFARESASCAPMPGHQECSSGNSARTRALVTPALCPTPALEDQRDG